MALSTIGTNSVADSAVTSAKISDGTIATGDLADDAVTGAKIENNPTIAGNLVVSGTTGLTGTVTASGATVGFVSFDKLLLDATDGSATDAGDNLILNGTDGTSANADSSILFEDFTNDGSAVLIGDLNLGMVEASTVKSEGRAVEQEITQGLCKAWTTYTDVSFSIGDSLNCSAASDNGTADFTTNFTNNFSSNNIVSAGISTYGTYVSYHASDGNSHTTSSVEYYTLTGGGAAQDPNFSHANSTGFNYQGDLA